MRLNITIDYTDDFNQARKITKSLDIDVMEGVQEPVIDPSIKGGGGEAVAIPSEENTLQKIWRFVLGLLGLDSAPPSNNQPEIAPGSEEPVPVIPKPGTGKG
jgi:hypothetical protein